MHEQILHEQDLQHAVKCCHHMKEAALLRLGLDTCIAPLFQYWVERFEN